MTSQIKHWKHFITNKDGYLDFKKTAILSSIIIDQLPHGSGINYVWTSHFLKNGKIQFFNSYDAMNENGMYCDILDFRLTVYFDQNDQLVFDRVNLINGSRESSNCSYGILEYLNDDLYYFIDEFNKLQTKIQNEINDQLDS